jgi:deoxycytidylate deaminase
MYGAWSTAKASACLKRNVGAVIVKPGSKRPVAIGEEMREATQTAAPVGSGYNENPDWMSPCYQEYRACYRDIWREKTWASMNIEYCPYCKAEIADLAWPYKCPNPECPSAGSLLDTFFPERAMTKCTALHAEARAILSCQSADLTGCHLYCTTFPCFLCAQKILQAGIIRVIYVEPYPDKDSEELLRNHGIEVKRFEG